MVVWFCGFVCHLISFYLDLFLFFNSYKKKSEKQAIFRKTNPNFNSEFGQNYPEFEIVKFFSSILSCNLKFWCQLSKINCRDPTSKPYRITGGTWDPKKCDSFYHPVPSRGSERRLRSVCQTQGEILGGPECRFILFFLVFVILYFDYLTDFRVEIFPYHIHYWNYWLVWQVSV